MHVLTNVLNTHRDSTEEEDAFHLEIQNESWNLATMFAEIPHKAVCDNSLYNEIFNEDNFQCMVNEPEIMDCLFALSDDKIYLNLRFENLAESPLNIEHICDEQYADNNF